MRFLDPPPVAGVNLQGALVMNCFLGAFPPIVFRSFVVGCKVFGFPVGAHPPFAADALAF